MRCGVVCSLHISDFYMRFGEGKMVLQIPMLNNVAQCLNYGTILGTASSRRC
jgi:hypothetical protein